MIFFLSPSLWILLSTKKMCLFQKKHAHELIFLRPCISMNCFSIMYFFWAQTLVWHKMARLFCDGIFFFCSLISIEKCPRSIVAHTVFFAHKFSPILGGSDFYGGSTDLEPKESRTNSKEVRTTNRNFMGFPNYIDNSMGSNPSTQYAESVVFYSM